MSKKLNILLIPLDNRPVSYCLPKQMAEINRNISLLLPPREIVGGLTDFTDTDKLFNWFEQEIDAQNIDYIVCCLDNVAYGGLIPSRRSSEAESIIIDRVKRFFDIISSRELKAKIYAFSSIMRISNNNINEEEKLYWDKYGELIFKYSFLSHKINDSPMNEDKSELGSVRSRIPDDVFADYIQTRSRNYVINRFYLSLLEEGFIDYLVYSQDDTAQYGMNVQEAAIFNQIIKDKNLSDKAVVRTGADEIPCDLVTRTICDNYNQKISIYPVFSTDNGKDIISRYEDKTIYESTKGQITLCGADIAESKDQADMVLLIHTPQAAQNDHCIRIYNDQTLSDTVDLIRLILDSDKPVFIADIAYANGGDSVFVEKLVSECDLKKLYGYAGWNTTGNTLGSVISMAISRFIAVKYNAFDYNKFMRLMLIRLSDDWAYQAIVRQSIRAKTNQADLNLLNDEMVPYIKRLSDKLELGNINPILSFPWDRTFEVEVDV